MGKRLRESRHELPETSPCVVTQDVPTYSDMELWQMYGMFSTKKLFRDSMSKIFIGGWSHWQFQIPNSRLPEGKQVFSINHMVYTV